MLGPDTFAPVVVRWWHCVPCGATNDSERSCCICGRRREDAIDASRWTFTLDAVVAQANPPCLACGEEIISLKGPKNDPYLYHVGCCDHPTVDLAMSDIDPARELLDVGTCTDCGAGVYLEHDEDRVYWEVMS
jgi:hypothetical protein